MEGAGVSRRSEADQIPQPGWGAGQPRFPREHPRRALTLRSERAPSGPGLRGHGAGRRRRDGAQPRSPGRAAEGCIVPASPGPPGPATCCAPGRGLRRGCGGRPPGPVPGRGRGRRRLLGSE